MKSPCYDYAALVAHFSKVATNNILQASKKRAKTEVKKQLDGLVDKAVPENVKDAVKDKLQNLFK